MSNVWMLYIEKEWVAEHQDRPLLAQSENGLGHTFLSQTVLYLTAERIHNRFTIVFTRSKLLHLEIFSSPNSRTPTTFEILSEILFIVFIFDYAQLGLAWVFFFKSIYYSVLLLSACVRYAKKYLCEKTYL